MVQIELTPIETDLLRGVLQRYLSEITLEMSFSHSHRKDFHEFFERRREFAEGVLHRLEKELALMSREVVSIDRLREVDILEGLAEEELQSIAQYFEEESLDAGVTLCEEGAVADRLYALEQGTVSIRSQKGGQYDIDIPGKIVGWSFLVPPFLYTASAVAKTPCKVLVIKSPDFYYVIHKEPKMGVKVINNLAEVIASRLKGHGNSS